MLRFILGRSGSGKTETIRNLLKNLAKDSQKKLILIVPEQFSFESERAMLHLLGAKDVQRVQVTSFTRLADSVFRLYGGAAGRRLDDGGRSIFMSLALEQVRDQLTFFRKNAESTELIGLLLSTSAELKMCEISPKILEQTSRTVPQSTLRQKIGELSLILSAYDALVAQSYIDPMEDLTRVRHILLENRYFSGCTVALDSFESFTVQEYQVISLILQQAEDVYVSLCTDRLDDSECGMGLFSLTRRTGKNLIRMAKQNGSRVASPTVLESGKRFRNSELAAIESGAYRFGRKETAAANGAVVIYEAGNCYDEAAFVASTIRNLVIHENYRYHDFAVIARSMEKYRSVLAPALECRKIPYFMDKPQAIEAEPLVRLVLSAFRIIQTGFSSDAVFAYLKTGLAGLETQAISQMENYVFVWNISGSKWKEEWTDHPQGFSETMTDGDKRLLKEINESRALAIAPLVRFANELKDADGEGMAAAVYRLLEAVGAPAHLKALAHRLADCGRPDIADRQLRLWDLLMNILDQTALVLREKHVGINRYAELLRLVILANNIASIPQGLDEVTVGTADRIRTNEPKVVFLIGAVQGEFPLAPGGNCVFSDSERRELIQLGLPLNDMMEGVAARERFLAYSALSAASEKLYLSYPVSGMQGESNTPSSIPSEVCSILKDIRIINGMMLPQIYFADAEEPAFELMAQQWNHNTELSATLKGLFEERGQQYRLQAIDRAAARRPAAFADSARARALFGGSMHVSATQIEKFFLCRFQYFCRYGLNAKERRTAELDALEYGSLMHFLLEKLFRNLGSEKILALPQSDLHTEIVNLLNYYVEARLGGSKSKTPRFLYLFSRVADSAGVIAVHIAQELSQSEFKPVDFELPIGSGGIPPLKITLPDGDTVEIDGKIDRVDLMTRENIQYIRVIDYKTGHKEFRLSDLIYGMNMQMLIYLAALSENGGNRYGDASPAGVLYMPANRPVISANRGISPEKLREESDKKLRMDGLVVDNAEVISAMERAGQGKYLPVALKDGAPAKRDHVVTEHELDGVMRHIKGLVAAMVSELHGGDVSALPLSGDYDACAWCPYSTVCGHEKEDSTRQMQKWDRDEAVRELTGMNGGEKK
ncbi:MAG TPA: PD-(D/E)XK nuclease family protein [Caproiciproducens sp.]|nr:PD-(D/E)XK nuclease family protein [Caproiciproducens sp.]